MPTQRYVIVSYALLGMLLWVTLGRLLSGVADVLDLPNPALIGSGMMLSSLLGLLVAAAASVLAYRNHAARTYSNEVVAELTKVTWPDRKETQRSTAVVIATSLVLATLMGIFDQVWGAITGLIYS